MSYSTWSKWTKDADPADFVARYVKKGVFDYDDMCSRHVYGMLMNNGLGADTPDLSSREERRIIRAMVRYLDSQTRKLCGGMDSRPGFQTTYKKVTIRGRRFTLYGA